MYSKLFSNKRAMALETSEQLGNEFDLKFEFSNISMFIFPLTAILLA